MTYNKNPKNRTSNIMQLPISLRVMFTNSRATPLERFMAATQACCTLLLLSTAILPTGALRMLFTLILHGIFKREEPNYTRADYVLGCIYWGFVCQGTGYAWLFWPSEEMVEAVRRKHDEEVEREKMEREGEKPVWHLAGEMGEDW